jgi:MOSC domain-containing protein YiiM
MRSESTTAKVISVNVSVPRELTFRGRTFMTGIFKMPVEGRVALRRLNFDGDAQADLSVHGGPYQAVYAYPSEHYVAWRREMPDRDLPWGMFGENLTIEGLMEEAVGPGDRLRVGSTELMVTKPRMPCFKLGAKFGTNDIIRRFAESGRSGFYLAVLQEGDVGAGDAIVLAGREEGRPTIAEVVSGRAAPQAE